MKLKTLLLFLVTPYGFGSSPSYEEYSQLLRSHYCLMEVVQSLRDDVARLSRQNRAQANFVQHSDANAVTRFIEVEKARLRVSREEIESQRGVEPMPDPLLEVLVILEKRRDHLKFVDWMKEQSPLLVLNPFQARRADFWAAKTQRWLAGDEPFYIPMGEERAEIETLFGRMP